MSPSPAGVVPTLSLAPTFFFFPLPPFLLCFQNSDFDLWASFFFLKKKDQGQRDKGKRPWSFFRTLASMTRKLEF